MKKIITLSIMIFGLLNGMEQPKPIAVKKTEKSRDLLEGIQAYQKYKSHEPLYAVTVNQLTDMYPKFFEYIPVQLYQAIADYMPYQYPTQSAMVTELQRMHNSPFLKKLITWKALGYYFGLMPYYDFNQGYFYFEQPVPKSADSILKGSRKGVNVRELGKLDARIQKLSHSARAQKDTLIAQAKKEWKEIAEALVTEYKIHLMPQGDPTRAIIALLLLLKHDPELQQLIAAFKVIVTDTAQDTSYPRVAIYLTSGKENAQKALNKLYAGLKEIPGSGIQPYFNAKVTDLIWIAQGDSHYKKRSAYQSYFQTPALVYFRKDLTGVAQNYHLIHPGTKQEIIN